MTRHNIPNVFPGQPVRFVGGVADFARPGCVVNTEHEHQGEVVGALVFSDGAAWLPIRAYGGSGELLVPIENLRA